MDDYTVKLDSLKKAIAEEAETDCRIALEAARQRFKEMTQAPDAEGSDEKPDLEKHLQRLDVEAQKSEEGWIRHLVAERDDWQKDLELALLRVRTRQAHIESDHSIHAKIQGKLVPKFQEARDLITLSLKKFKETEASDDEPSDLKAMILSESRSMLRSLRKEPSLKSRLSSSRGRSLKILKIATPVSSMPSKNFLEHIDCS